MGLPLEGIRVLDLSRVMSGPFAATMLGDLGADVTKIESAGTGDILRHTGGHSRGGISAIFLGLNRGKRSISIDFRHPDAAAVVRDLAVGADVLIENFRPGVCDAMGIGPDSLRAANSGLIYVSITGFGTDSPDAEAPAYDTMIQGRTAMAARQRRRPDADPDLVRSYLVDKLAGFFASQGILAALYQPRVGTVRQPRHPVRFENQPGHTGHTAPLPGEHTVEVLIRFGFDPSRIESLLASGVVQQLEAVPT